VQLDLLGFDLVPLVPQAAAISRGPTEPYRWPSSLQAAEIPGANGSGDFMQGGIPSFQTSNWANMGNANTGSPFLLQYLQPPSLAGNILIRVKKHKRIVKIRTTLAAAHRQRRQGAGA
jgi:hypothetical protein